LIYLKKLFKQVLCKNLLNPFVLLVEGSLSLLGK
jgi:hypothetical protein